MEEISETQRKYWDSVRENKKKVAGTWAFKILFRYHDPRWQLPAPSKL